MLKSLSVLPEEIKTILREYSAMSEFCGIVDQFYMEDKKVWGCLYVVMMNGCRPCDDKYEDLHLRALDYGESVGWSIWDETPILRVSTEKSPLIFVDIEDLEEGVDYRRLSIDEVRKELS